MSEFKLKFEHVDSVPMADITEKGIKYGKHDFNAKVTVKDDKGKDQEITVCRRAEREWMLGKNNGLTVFTTAHSGLVFCLDETILKAEAEKVYANIRQMVEA